MPSFRPPTFRGPQYHNPPRNSPAPANTPQRPTAEFSGRARLFTYPIRALPINKRAVTNPSRIPGKSQSEFTRHESEFCRPPPSTATGRPGPLPLIHTQLVARTAAAMLAHDVSSTNARSLRSLAR